MRKLLMLSILLLPAHKSFCQIDQHKSSSWSVTAGYGLAGSLFVRSYSENPNGLDFLKKNFIGKGLTIGLAKSLRRNFELSLNYSFQEFTRHVKVNAVNSNVALYLDHTIRHQYNFYDFSVKKKVAKKQHVFVFGLGLLYIRPIQEEIGLGEINNVPAISIEDRSTKNSEIDDLGIVPEVAYEYRFQPKMSIGLKIQYFQNITAMIAESAALLPYLRYSF